MDMRKYELYVEAKKAQRVRAAEAARARAVKKTSTRRKLAKAVRQAKKADVIWELNSEIKRRKIYAQAQATEEPEDARKASIERNCIAASVRAKLRRKKAAAHMREIRAARRAITYV
jgi:hypothetical protein